MKTLLTIMGFSLLLSGCRTMTGKSAGQTLSDAKITATVKSSLARRDRIGTLTRVNVTTVDKNVYLTGILPTETEKEKAEDIAERVAGVRDVINNIEVRP